MARQRKKTGGCYKTNSYHKLLSLKENFSRRFFGDSSESLDFSRFGMARSEAINKVIHRIMVFYLNFFEIKHLGGVSETAFKRIG